MLSKRKIFSILLFSLLIFFVCLPRIIPPVFDNLVLPRLREQSGIPSLEATLRHIGWNGMELRDLTIGKNENGAAIFVDSIRVDFSLRNLVKPAATKVRVVGLEMSCRYEDGKWSIPGLPESRKKDREANEKDVDASIEAMQALLAAVPAIELRHGLIRFHHPGGIHILPIEARLSTREEKTPALPLVEVEVRLYPSGDSLAARGILNPREYRASGDFLFSLSPASPLLANILAVPLLSPGGRLSVNGGFDVGMDLSRGDERSINGELKEIRLVYEGKREDEILFVNDGNLRFSGKVGNQGMDGEGFIQFPAPRLGWPGVKMSAGFLIVQLKLMDGKVGAMPDLAVHVDVPGFDFKAGTLGAAGDVGFDGKLAVSPSLQLHGQVGVEKGTVLAGDISLSGVEVQMPLSWPAYGQKGGKGTFKTAMASWGKKKMGSLNVALRETSEGLSMDGTAENAFSPELPLMMKGHLDYLASGGPRFHVRTLADRRKVVAPDLGDLMPDLAGASLDGLVSVDGKAEYARDYFDATLRLTLEDGTLAVPDKHISIKGINLDLSLVDFVHLRSLPASFSFDSARVDKIELDDGSFVFQIDGTESFLIERGSIAWCGGRVFFPFIRLTPETSQYDLDIYCDRLNLAALLDQFGFSGSEGEGEVNGRIPLRVSEDTIRFEDGFLYSTPGSGGRIRVSNSDILKTAVPRGTFQYYQIDFVAEALKDFAYNWAKLRIMSKEADDALIQLSLDGKSAKPLPFEYRNDIGAYVRVDEIAGGIVNQPIRLDVNFHLPLGKILGYGNSLKKIWDLVRP